MQAADKSPIFQIDAAWPKPLTDSSIVGQMAGTAVDTDEIVWILRRPRSLTDDEKAASFNPRRRKCCLPVLLAVQFDQEGSLLRAWGARVTATTGRRTNTA